MKECKDEVFGGLVFGIDWGKNDKIKLFNREYEIAFRIVNSGATAIKEIQKESYRKYLLNEKMISDIMLEKIKDCIERNLDLFSEYSVFSDYLNSYKKIADLIKPKSYYFREDGSIFIEFDFNIDIDEEIVAEIDFDDICNMKVDIAKYFYGIDKNKEIKKYNDEVFGDIIFNIDWEKDNKVKLFNREWKVSFLISDYEKTGIKETQRESYRKYLANEKIISDIIIEKIEDYIKKSFEFLSEYCDLTNYLNGNEKTIDLVRPMYYVFEENGDILIEFEFTVNKEYVEKGIMAKINFNNIYDIEVDIPELFL
ncbi:DUF6985 domain-containing protein [Oceanivirga salmonicida]|uniref:DUF6985 domain-containing protein n=1 Tax=Oceanivirga salmonicida TaxID=1769291 RepID=UPI00083649BC|nr:hypothetical protein [Oceanivirga salmonicida]